MNSRRFVRLSLFGAGAMAATVALAPLVSLGATSVETWATAAAALAVITAVVAAWSSQRVLELHEDAQEPVVVVGIDARRRYQLVQFRVANVGGSPAHDVQIHWNQPLTDADGKAVRISETSEGPDRIPVLLPKESTAIVLGASHRFFGKHRHQTFGGRVSYRNSSGRSREHSFGFSTDVHEKSLVHDEEEPKTLFELQKLPKLLEQVATEIALLREALGGPNNTDDERR